MYGTWRCIAVSNDGYIHTKPKTRWCFDRFILIIVFTCLVFVVVGIVEYDENNNLKSSRSSENQETSLWIIINFTKNQNLFHSLFPPFHLSLFTNFRNFIKLNVFCNGTQHPICHATNSKHFLIRQNNCNISKTNKCQLRFFVLNICCGCSDNIRFGRKTELYNIE